MKHLGATVSLRVAPGRLNILRDFEQFARLVLGIDPSHPEVSMPARLYRVGTANAADAGLDMWANFGPAIQVKHISVSLDDVDEITDRIMADQVVVVCKQAEARVIEAVMKQTDQYERIWGFITETNLIDWYGLCSSKKYASTLGRSLIVELSRQFALEFPASNAAAVEAFFRERGYKASALTGAWARAAP